MYLISLSQTRGLKNIKVSSKNFWWPHLIGIFPMHYVYFNYIDNCARFMDSTLWLVELLTKYIKYQYQNLLVQCTWNLCKQKVKIPSFSIIGHIRQTDKTGQAAVTAISQLFVIIIVLNYSDKKLLNSVKNMY